MDVTGEPRLHEPVLFNEHVGKSIYYEQLRRWFDHFPRDRFYVCTLEDFSKVPQALANPTPSHALDPNPYAFPHPRRKS